MTPGPGCGDDQALEGRVGIKGGALTIACPGARSCPRSTQRPAGVFLTGTAAEVTPIGEIDEHHYQVGPITRRLIEGYDKIAPARGGGPGGVRVGCYARSG